MLYCISLNLPTLNCELHNCKISNGLIRKYMLIMWLNQFFVCVSRELKDNLGSDEPEGDAPLLLQTMLARNPGIFREKSRDTTTCAHCNMKAYNHKDKLHFDFYKKKILYFLTCCPIVFICVNLFIFSCLISEQMLCSSQWYSTKSPKIPCIARPSLQTSSRQQFLPIHQGGSSWKIELTNVWWYQKE